MAVPLTHGRLAEIRDRYDKDAHWARNDDDREAALEMRDVLDLALLGITLSRANAERVRRAADPYDRPSNRKGRC